MTDSERSLIVQLRGRGNSYKQIADVMGLSVNTIKTCCRRNFAGENMAEDERACEMCGVVFKTTKKKPTRRFCSDKCRMNWWAANRANIKKKAFYSFTCQQCGKRFQAYGNDHRKFCSVGCYADYRRGGAKDGC